MCRSKRIRRPRKHARLDSSKHACFDAGNHASRAGSRWVAQHGGAAPQGGTSPWLLVLVAAVVGSLGALAFGLRILAHHPRGARVTMLTARFCGRCASFSRLAAVLIIVAVLGPTVDAQTGGGSTSPHRSAVGPSPFKPRVSRWCAASSVGGRAGGSAVRRAAGPAHGPESGPLTDPRPRPARRTCGRAARAADSIAPDQRPCAWRWDHRGERDGRAEGPGRRPGVAECVLVSRQWDSGRLGHCHARRARE